MNGQRAVLLAALLAMCGCSWRGEPRRNHVRMYCMADLEPLAERLIKGFTKSRDIRVDVKYIRPDELNERFQRDESVGLFLYARIWSGSKEESLVQARGMGGKGHDLGHFTPCLIVPKGNPEGIRSVSDLRKPGVVSAGTWEESCLLSRVSESGCRKPPKGPAKPPPGVRICDTDYEAAQLVARGRIDGAVVWNFTRAAMGSKVNVVEAKGLERYDYVHHLMVSQPMGTSHPELAEAFIEFAAGPEGQSILRRMAVKVDARRR